jgi:hypothetical protein
MFPVKSKTAMFVSREIPALRVPVKEFMYALKMVSRVKLDMPSGKGPLNEFDVMISLLKKLSFDTLSERVPVSRFVDTSNAVSFVHDHNWGREDLKRLLLRSKTVNSVRAVNTSGSVPVN